ncbi:MAG: hypothetical protein R3E55_04010 [Burkholderiaceae bacterium]
MVDKPRIGEVLPVFHALRRTPCWWRAQRGVRHALPAVAGEELNGDFLHQPVLDTPLLSAVVHPHQDSHRLEAIAERFNVTVLWRHTALGDALVTAEICCASSRC